MNLSVIICTWNRSKTLALTLASLEASDVPIGIEWEVLVVDNNSTDDTSFVCQTFVEKASGRFRYLFEKQQGKSFALNAGILQARGEILVFTDDDATVGQQWLSEIYETFRRHQCSGVAGRIVPRWACKQPSWIDLDGPYRHEAYGGIVRFEKGDVPHALNCTAAGANVAFRRSVFQKYGLFRTDLGRTIRYFMSGSHADLGQLNDLAVGEDTEYCRRLLDAGEKIMYAPGAIVFHPVEEYRTDRKYFYRLAFQYGRYMVRVDGIPDGAKRYWGIPRYMFPVALKFFVGWITSVVGKRRFYYRLQLSTTFGQMNEARLWLHNRQARKKAREFGAVR